MNRKKLVVFDWNGTLLADTATSWRAANMCLEFYGARPITLARYRESFHFPVIHFYTLNGVSTDTVLARKEEANTLFQETYDNLAKQCRLRRGARDLLSDLAGRGIDRIILSNYLTDKITMHLKRLGIANCFSHISAHDCDGSTILQSTTKAERLSAFMLKRGYRPENITIIGDSMEEPDIARRLGLRSIGITDGYISTPRLRAAAPDHIVRSLRDVPALV